MKLNSFLVIFHIYVFSLIFLNSKKTKIPVNDIKIAGKSLLMKLRLHKLKLVTIESLTSGMIISNLVNIPNFGGSIYGGFAVYDTDAKRRFVGVSKRDYFFLIKKTL